MDDVDIICAANVAVCKDILKNFLTSFQKDHLLKKIQEKTEKEITLSKSSIFIFFDSPKINEDISTTLDTVDPDDNFIMIVVVTHGRKEKKRRSGFTLPSKVIMWCFIWGAEDRKCPNTEENLRANIMLDCFLKIISRAMKIKDKEDTLSTSYTKSRVDQEVQPMDTETDLTNEISDGVDGAVIVACSRISESFFESFSHFMETKIGVSTRRSNISKSANHVALCVQHDDTKKEIQELYSVTGRSATLIMITACEDGVPLPPIQSSIGKDMFPDVRLRYSDTDETIYDCPENKEAEEMLKKIFRKYRKSSAISWMEPSLPKKNQAKKSQDSSKVTKKETKLAKSSSNRAGEQMKTSEHSFPNSDFVILCNRKVEVCKDILMKFKARYSVSNEFQWMSNARDARNVRKRVLVCLKISRLADDIKDAIERVNLSDADTFFLVIIHTAEPGIEVDTSFPSWDPRIVDVAHILYSESSECYVCPENKSAISKFRSWFKYK